MNLTGRPVKTAPEDRQRFNDAIDLAAETAADGTANEMQPRRGHVQELRCSPKGEKQRLGRGVTDKSVIGFGRSDRAAGLDRRLLDRRHLVFAFNDVIGF